MRNRMMPLVLLLAVGAGAAACDGDGTQPVVDPPALPAMERDGVRAAMVVEDRSDDVITLAIHLDARSLALGSYQGHLEFDTDRFTLIDAAAPGGQDGFRVANAAEAGMVRFAGFTTGSFTAPVAVRLRLRSRGELVPGSLTLALEVAGTVEGAPVAASRYQVPRELFRAPTSTGR